MKKDKQQARYDRGQVFVKIVAGLLAIMMVVAVAASVLFVLFR